MVVFTADIEWPPLARRHSLHRLSAGLIMVVVGKHFTFLFIVVWWEIPT